VPFVKVPDPDVAQRIVPLLELPDVVNVFPAQILASRPALALAGLLSLSVIVITPAPSKIEAFIGSVSVILMVSLDSRLESSVIKTLNVFDVWPAVKVNVPEVVV
jgi:hypothetical protein